jgi:hypothetical protein
MNTVFLVVWLLSNCGTRHDPQCNESCSCSIESGQYADKDTAYEIYASHHPYSFIKEVGIFSKNTLSDKTIELNKKK